MVALSRYRADLPAVSIVGAVTPEHLERARARVDQEIDELAVVHDAIRFQQQRVELGRAAEVADGRTGKTVAADIDLMATLAVRAHQMKMDLGIRPRRQEPAKLGVEEDRRWQKYPAALQRALSNPSSRAKVISIVQQLSRRVREEKDRQGLEH